MIKAVCGCTMSSPFYIADAALKPCHIHEYVPCIVQISLLLCSYGSLYCCCIQTCIWKCFWWY